MKKRYRVLVADPPWPFKDKLPGRKRGAAKHYRMMTLAEIQRFPLPPMLAHCVLLLWRVGAMQEEALSVVRAWGFVAKAEMVWIKETKTGKRWFGMGRQVRAEHETAIIAIRGRPIRRSGSVRSTFRAAVGEHSVKPEEFYGLVRKLYRGPYVELFAGRRRRGWTCLGVRFKGKPIQRSVKK